VLCAIPALAQSQQPRATGGQKAPAIAEPGTAVSAGDPNQSGTGTGSISGTIVDQTSTPVSGVAVTLTRENGLSIQETSDDDGQFFFVNVAPGPFHLRLTAPGFMTQTVSGTVNAGEAYTVPELTLVVAGVATEVQVMPRAELAEIEVKQEEKQRVLGVPNFYVTYSFDAVPLDMKQKFNLAWRTVIDPVTFGLAGFTAGAEQAANEYSGYGQGAEGYGKRFGAAYADDAISTFLGSALLPSLLRQDPRFFFKEHGSKASRALYAIAASVICKGDSGRWQPNYSSFGGSLAAGAISNLYYPNRNRTDVATTFANTAIGVGETAGENLLEEFVVPRFEHKKPAKSGGNQSTAGDANPHW
jgi:Carboxypeptidase regulatory-like domain